MSQVTSSLLNEETRRKSTGSSHSEALVVNPRGRSRGRSNTPHNRDQSRGSSRGSSRGRSPSKQDIECHYCKKKGHMKRECLKLKFKEENRAKHGDKKQENTTAVSSDGELVVVCDETCVNLVSQDTNWVIDFGASFHVTSRADFFTSYNEGDFGCVRMGNEGLSKIVGMGNICLETNIGCKLVLKDVRHVPDIRLNLISTGKLDDEGYNNHFGNGKWKLTKGSLVVAKGNKTCSLYMMKGKISKGAITLTKPLSFPHPISETPQKMRQKSELRTTTKLLKYVLIGLIVFLGLICLYSGSSVAPGLRKPGNAVDDGADPVISRFVTRHDFDEFDDQEHNPEVPKSIPICDRRYSELIPCLDRNLIYQLRLKPNMTLMEHYERHCPPPQRRYNCLIPPPNGYKIPIRWPASRDEVWKANIPHTHLALEKSDQNWMVVDGDKIKFPGGGTHFHDGADKYISAIAGMLKFPGDKLSNGGNIRNVLDVGCGVASFGAYLLPLDIIAMSLAPNDVHENQIQFALERGIPSTLGVLGTRRLPFPSRSFELAHCSRCRIDWLQRRGILLLELDRLIQPGGYFVYSSPEAYAHDAENRRIWNAMYDLLRRMCWRVVSRKEQTVVWAKPLSNSCYLKRNEGTHPPLCSSDDDPDASWNVLMKLCITPYSAKMHREKGSGLEPWPKRLTAAPPRLEEVNVSPDEFHEDTSIWHYRVTEYWKQMKSVIRKDSFRNVMDMHSNLGGFAAAVKDKDVWVMNVAPVNSSSRLKIIYDRGLIGTVHDWCESFSTYPRTYDLLHAWTVFSEIESRGCSAEDLLIEMDRILRPEGLVIIRDKPSIINHVRKFLTALRWDGWLSEVEPRIDALSSNEERVLIARKKLWGDEAAIM
ncbi:hypothetical protein RHSIM_Rhsim10G0014000 [Rhododendron simsii]|uniref:CCHC-type domain-containing protein n=1 Tax=Rhododendron simsii TaxID=118357 RepID=A0A834GAB6_RHOSS|nr:hypothetical protein RHSIM_Rhsim10G0014000 [Rhododendron simsii]